MFVFYLSYVLENLLDNSLQDAKEPEEIMDTIDDAPLNRWEHGKGKYSNENHLFLKICQNNQKLQPIFQH